jgi:hypothetical protein
MTVGIPGRLIGLVGVVLAGLVVGGCSSTASSTADAGFSGSAVVPTVNAGQGTCRTTCPRSCDVDNDCATELGELCCDYGTGKVCQPAEACPVFCTGDSVCQTSLGQACVVTSLALGAPAACDDAGAGLKFCQSGADCGPTQTCCGNYDRPICTDTSACPAACTRDAQCDANRGEICCTTVQAVEPNLSATGLCLDPAVQP